MNLERYERFRIQTPSGFLVPMFDLDKAKLIKRYERIRGKSWAELQGEGYSIVRIAKPASA